jgi:SAM-dependent methyltransferase
MDLWGNIIMNKNKIDREIQGQYNQLWQNEWRELHQVGPSVRTRNRFLIRFFKKYLSSGSVIDTGCGDGQFLKLLYHSFGDRFSYTAGDISDQALQAVQKSGFIKDIWVIDVTFKETLPETKYSAVVSSEVLEHIEDWQTALTNITNLVNDKGYIFITVPALMKHWGIHDDFAHHIQRFEMGQIETVLEGLNFKILESTCWGWPMFDLYYRFILNRSAPESVMTAVTSPFKRMVSTCLYYLFFIDDLFKTSQGRRLFIAAQKNE